MIAKLSLNEGVCIDGRWKGWFCQRHPDGQWIAIRKLGQIDPLETNPLSTLMANQRTYNR